MKAIKNLICIISTIFFFTSCDSPVSFHEPQPTNTKNLYQFPKKLHGEYLNKERNQLLRINSNCILSIYDFDLKAAKNELDSTYELIGDTVYDIFDSTKTFVITKGDSLTAHIHSEDTLFFISNQNILRKYKGYYFLNAGDTTHWTVEKIFIEKGILSISNISAEEEINNLREITESIDTTSYHFKPTKKQFGTFVRKNGFKYSDYYVRLKK